MAARFGGEPLLGPAATPASVRAAVDPLDGSYLALAGAPAPAGRWTARAIQRFHFAGRPGLAVLSGCRTGLGAAHDAGIKGLARAFQLAGVPRVVVSLWSVDDAATAALMAEFAAALATQPPHLALHAAMRARRAVDPDPAHWAAFMLFGTPR